MQNSFTLLINIILPLHTFHPLFHPHPPPFKNDFPPIPIRSKKKTPFFSHTEKHLSTTQKLPPNYYSINPTYLNNVQEDYVRSRGHSPRRYWYVSPTSHSLFFHFQIEPSISKSNLPKIQKRIFSDIPSLFPL
eukprot:TRINITY_DN186_c0_g1_i4.p1 TRINITY_DN186_c0_g1~~TRINITY_DN186_c0_g1_i4.p1  ORF type:complete len:133 (+),score=2.19 TRINITY_DN186_c0_g1_i4:362-760(+)